MNKSNSFRNKKDNILILKYNFEYKKDLYEANAQFRKRKNGDLDINIGYYGDEFPCVILNYNFRENVFKIDRIRAQAFGGYSNDDRMLCLRNIETKTFLPEKGSLDILIFLSIAIYEHLYDNNFLRIENTSKPSILIKDMAMKDEYPLSWLKYIQNPKDENSFGYQTTYSKYGFRLRGMEPQYNLCSDFSYYDLPNMSFSFEKYVYEEIPEILNMNFKELLKKISKNDYVLFMTLLNDFNKFLKNKYHNKSYQNFIKIKDNTTVLSFILNVFQTKRQNEYKKLLCHLDTIIHFDIRGYWYLDYSFYQKIEEKVKIRFIEEF
jgi:hypothetical protein